MGKRWVPGNLDGRPLFYLWLGDNGKHRKVYPQAVQLQLRDFITKPSDPGGCPQEVECQPSDDERQTFRVRLFTKDERDSEWKDKLKGAQFEPTETGVQQIVGTQWRKCFTVNPPTGWGQHST